MKSQEWNRISPEYRSLIINAQQNVPIKLGALSKQLGLVIKLSTMPANISGQIKPDNNSKSGYKIKINRHEYKTRQRFTLAHEIAHFLLHKELIGDGIEDNVLFRSSLSDTIEAQANRLAADILMPWDKLEHYLKLIEKETFDKINYLANTFEVSEHAMRIRLGKD